MLTQVRLVIRYSNLNGSDWLSAAPSGKLLCYQPHTSNTTNKMVRAGTVRPILSDECINFMQNAAVNLLTNGSFHRYLPTGKEAQTRRQGLQKEPAEQVKSAAFFAEIR